MPGNSDLKALNFDKLERWEKLLTKGFVEMNWTTINEVILEIRLVLE